MKNAFTSTLALTIVGLAVLVAGALYFGAPLFGWVIMAAIFLVFVIEQVQSLKIMKQIAVESLVLDDCERRDSFNVTQEGIVQKRFELARKLLANNIRLDSPMAYEVMSNSVSVSIPRGAGGTVILLGLMGTFFGLMYSVATAGGAIDNSTTQGTLDTIQMLFQGMKGIFGTSLCGLFAALILNGTRTMLIASRERFVSRLDVMTLNLQGSATGEFEQNKNDLERLFDSVEKSLSDVSAAVQSGLSEVVRKVGDNMSSALQEMSVKVNDSVEKISQSMQNIGGAVTESLSGAFAPMEDSVKNLAVIVEGIPSKLDEKLKGMTSSLQSGLEGVANATRGTMEGISKDITSSVVEQVKKSEEQWNGFMARLEAETSSSVEAQRSGLESLKDVALQVAEKAQAGSAELSQSVSEKLGTLSNDILGAFQKLSETSSVLLEAQKALTESIDNRVVKEKEATDALGGNIVETAELMRVNQSELSANLEMLRAGLETILEKLSGDTKEREDEENFVEHLNQSLEAFHERASEVLMENAVKTQEILLEVLEQTQRSSVQPRVEG